MKILLKEIRRKRKLSLRQLEIITGVSKSALSRIENEKISPTMDDMEKIAAGLGIGITDLFVSEYKYKKRPDIGTK